MDKADESKKKERKGEKKEWKGWFYSQSKRFKLYIFTKHSSLQSISMSREMKTACRQRHWTVETCCQYVELSPGTAEEEFGDMKEIVAHN